MGKVTGFLELDRQDRKYRPAADRVRNFKEFFIELPEQTLQAQASRCMDRQKKKNMRKNKGKS